MSNVVGKWKLDKAENMDGFMKACGAPEELLKKALENKEKHLVEISNNGNKWAIKSEGMKFNHEFELGKETEDVGFGGRKSKNTSSIDGNKLVTDSKQEDGKIIHIERWIEGDRLITTMSHGGATCHHEFVKA